MALRNFDGLAHGRDNNFNLIRMLAASAVVVSHSFPLPQGHWTEPFINMGFTLGGAAVAVFFALSGFLIFKSFERRPSIVEFAVARILRIVPALAVVAILTAFVVGPLFTRLPLADYFGDRHSWQYVPQVLSLRWLPGSLPGLFELNPRPQANGPLWTLYYEVACYICLGLAGLVGMLKPRYFPFLLLLYAAAYVILLRQTGPRQADAWNYAYLSLPFAVGMIVYRYRGAVPAHFGLVVALGLAAAAATYCDVLGPELRLVALAYLALWAARAESPILLRYNRLGDYSYGVYIYGWPIQQMAVSLYPDIHPLLLIAVALPAATLCGAISWYFIERPALTRKDEASEWALGLLSRFARFRSKRRAAAPEPRPAIAKD
jgi:peptidoglycan/LPS O-acetylase OafA/YrhL